MIANLERLCRSVVEDIDIELQRIGILYRIFARAKTDDSIKMKLEKKGYSTDGKKMQDLVGIRVVVYFKDDLPLVLKALKSKLDFVDETIDLTNEKVFEPNRINLIFRLNPEYITELEEVVIRKYGFIDTTYEVQLRTILSEGWHEIEHDLRYKCQEDWNEYMELSRTLNGIYAALETNDWSILSLFDTLAYSHYKSGNVEAMIRNKFRIRFKGGAIDPNLLTIISNNQVLKAIYRVDRIELLNKIFEKQIKVPLTMNNLIYLINLFFIKNIEIDELTPSYIVEKSEILQ